MTLGREHPPNQPPLDNTQSWTLYEPVMSEFFLQLRKMGFALHRTAKIKSGALRGFPLVRRGQIRNFRPLGTFFLVEVEFLVLGGSFGGADGK